MAAVGLFTFLTLRQAWVGEDAFITFRTIDNLVNGYGLRWNVDERVQSYTHPLWLLVNSLVYYLTHEICWSVTAVGLIFSVAALVTLGARYAGSPLILVAGLFLPLALSSAYVTYSASGFENSLSHFCYALFAVLFLRQEETEKVPWGGLALAAALGATNRIDTTLFFVPPLLLLLISRWSTVRWRSVLLGFSPLMAWLLFSLFYYGFFLPNTGLAKINEEVAFGDYFRQGLFYALDLSRRDPIGMLLIGFGIAVTVIRLVKALFARTDMQSRRLASLGVGMLLYCFYVLSIGGCFLSGRFWTTSILVGAILWCEELRGVGRRPTTGRVSTMLLATALAIVLLIAARSTPPQLLGASRSAPIRDRSAAHKFLTRDWEWRSNRWARSFERVGIKFRRRAENGVTHGGVIGLAGITAGREIIVVDRLGLADPLLARLPPISTEIRRIGHFSRSLPTGYLAARRTGSLEPMDPALREYYRPLRSIVSDPLFSPQRIATILSFNLGKYDRYLEDWLAGAPHQAADVGAQDNKRQK